MLTAPKNPRANAAFRKAILERARGDKAFQEELWIRCARDPIFFLDVFCYTYDPKNYPDCPHRPFVTWDYQERTINQLVDAISTGHDLLAEKSRQMGFTWMMIAVFVWYWMFRGGVSFLLGSRKEELVDKPGDPASLFWKADYLLETLPGWLRPAYTRTERHYHNVDNDSTIDGESTNDNFARGGTRTAIALDEFPAVENGSQILTSTRDATNCRIFIGTPMGAVGAFYDQRVKFDQYTPERIITLIWSLHPEKAVGMYSIEGCDEGMPPTIIDKSYKFPEDFKFLDVAFPEYTTRSIWFNEQALRAATKQELAQEVMIDYAASAWQYFDPVMIAQLKKACCAPKHIGEILFGDDWKKPRWNKDSRGNFRLWFDWPDPDLPGMIPKEWNDISCGVDLCTGKAGEMSSNSVATFFRRSTGRKIAQITEKFLYPNEFCDLVVAACHWFNNAYLCHEENGPGGVFTAQLIRLGYHNVFMRDDSEKKFAQKKTMKIGWNSSKETKKLLLADYRDALKNGVYENPCVEAMDETLQYIHHPNGTILHARSMSTEDPTATGEGHGDMVIADALAWRAACDLAKRELEKQATEPTTPRNSFQGRWESFRARRQREPYRWGSFAG